MKSKSIAIITCGGLFATAALADVTVDITGATAFRAATLLSIKAKFDESGVAYQYAHDQAAGAFSGATRSIWKGTFPGVSGVTTIRTSFNGSVQGIRALVDSPAQDPTYYSDVAGNLITAAAIGGGETHTATSGFTKTTETAQSEIAFSDVSVASTPFAGFSLQPADPAAGVVVFTMLTNEGSTVTNVTEQAFRALLTTGFQPKSLLTGNAADSDLVFVTGRNDGSGTRTTYLAESGYGITNTVQQFIVNQSSGNANTVIQLVPAGGVNTPALPGQSTANASTVWGQDVAGNGGYESGSSLRSAMGRTCGAVTVLDDAGNDAFGSPQPVSLVTWLSLNDAITARDGGAVFCAYNGVKLNDIATSGSAMSAADLQKVTHGAYTAWGYQQMYRRNDLTSGDAVTVYNGIKAAVQTNLGAAGVPVTSMAVARATDGGVVGTTAF
jgi:hypothetical protein